MSDRLDWRVGTLIDVLADRARSAPDAVVYTFLTDGDGQEKRLTHAQLDGRARALARLLQRMTQPGDRALLLYPDGLEYISGLFGCLYAGLVPVSGVPPLVPRSVERFVNVTGDCNPAVVLGTRAVLSEFGTELAADVTVRVHDSTADMRYLVLPLRPAGTDGWSEERLAALVTRDSMVGVSVPRPA